MNSATADAFVWSTKLPSSFLENPSEINLLSCADLTADTTDFLASATDVGSGFLADSSFLRFSTEEITGSFLAALADKLFLLSTKRSSNAVTPVSLTCLPSTDTFDIFLMPEICLSTSSYCLAKVFWWRVILAKSFGFNPKFCQNLLFKAGPLWLFHHLKKLFF